MTFTKNDYVEVYRKWKENINCIWVDEMDAAIGMKGYVTESDPSVGCIIAFLDVNEYERKYSIPWTYYFPHESLRFVKEEDSAPPPEGDLLPLGGGGIESREPTADVVQTLLNLAAAAQDEDRAVKFSQAALNAANALALTKRNP